jgi:hypothetical protein
MTHGGATWARGAALLALLARYAYGALCAAGSLLRGGALYPAIAADSVSPAAAGHVPSLLCWEGGGEEGIAAWQHHYRYRALACEKEACTEKNSLRGVFCLLHEDGRVSGGWRK